ncbi:MAG: SDR family NAD(P)-dependent oxidoreductase, partial [Sphingobacteriales bacterium]
MKRVALVTGGSRGIGFGVATELALQGFDLAVNGVRPLDAVSGNIAILEALGARVLYCQADVSMADQRAQMLADIRRYYGALHVLVNNAGVAPLERKDILEATEESFDRLMNINLRYACVKKIIHEDVPEEKVIENKDLGSDDICKILLN